MAAIPHSLTIREAEACLFCKWQAPRSILQLRSEIYPGGLLDPLRQEPMHPLPRASAANSAVCFAVGVTEVDSTRMNMRMERFVSTERNEPPNIDTEHERS